MISAEDFTNIVNEYGYFRVHDFKQREDCNAYLDHELVIIPYLCHLNEIPSMNVYDEVDMENFERFTTNGNKHLSIKELVEKKLRNVCENLVKKYKVWKKNARKKMIEEL